MVIRESIRDRWTDPNNRIVMSRITKMLQPNWPLVSRLRNSLRGEMHRPSMVRARIKRSRIGVMMVPKNKEKCQ